MNTLTRVAIIANFVLALGFALTSLILYAKQVNWAQTANKLVSIRNELVTELERTKAESQARIGRLEAENGDLRTKNAALATAETRLQQEVARLQEEKTKQDGTIATLTASRQTDAKTISDSREDLARAKQEAEKLRQDLLTADTKRTQAVRMATEVAAEGVAKQEQIVSLGKQIHDLILKNEELETIVTRAEATNPGIRLTVATAPVAIDGRVERVDAPNRLVVVNVGSRHGVVTGMDFTMSRGPNFLGKAQARTVEPDMSVLYMLDITKDPAAIKVNDKVSVR